MFGEGRGLGEAAGPSASRARPRRAGATGSISPPQTFDLRVARFEDLAFEAAEAGAFALPRQSRSKGALVRPAPTTSSSPRTRITVADAPSAPAWRNHPADHSVPRASGQYGILTAHPFGRGSRLAQMMQHVTPRFALPPRDALVHRIVVLSLLINTNAKYSFVTPANLRHESSRRPQSYT